MSCRRNTANRLNLIRACGTCGKEFGTTADSPWMRQVLTDGRQLIKYYCSQSCFRASYKYRGYWDGKAEERRKEREANRDISAKNRLYYERHREQELARARARYWAAPEAARADNAYQKQKRKLLREEAGA